MEYRVLGPLEVIGPKGPLAFDSRKQRQMLATLLLSAGRSVRGEALVAALWAGGGAPADPAAALHTHVSRLRRLLREGGAEPDAIVTDALGYRLNVGDAAVDAVQFEALIREARHSGDREAALATLETALALWRGPAYADVADQPSAAGAVTWLNELLVAAREHKGELLLGLGRHDDAIAWLETLAASDPLRERPQALRMEALYGAGRQADALAVFQEFRRRLSAELGLETSPALRDLERRIIRHEVVIAAAPTLPRLPGPDLRIAYLTLADGRSIAYGTAGAGRVLVVPPAFVTNLATIAAGDDVRSAFLHALAERFRLVLWDRHGTGLSAGSMASPSLTDVTEFRAILDHLEIEQAAFLAVSAAGPPTAAFAAEQPDRVSHLVFLGTFADGPATFAARELTESMLSLVQAHWGLGSKVLTDMMYPGASLAFAERFARSQRAAASAQTAAAILDAMYHVTVADRLGRIRAPTMIIHYEKDRAIPFAGGRGLAAGIPAARLVPLPGRSHLPDDEDIERVARLIADFVSP